jgi:uncharacterized protein with PIN domain
MTVLDAQAIVAFLVDEPAKPEVEALLLDEVERAAVSAGNLAEAVDVLTRIHGNGAKIVLERLDWLEVGGLNVVPVDSDIGRRAGSLRARHYDRASRPVSLGDCLALATAIRRGTRLATADPHLLAMAGDEGVEVLALPDSRGRRP